MHWWLPNDEGYPPIIRSIRKFVEERTSPATDLPGEDLRDMKAIFASLKLDDGKSSIPPKLNKGKGAVGNVAVAGSQDWRNSTLDRGLDPSESEHYGLEDTHGFFGHEQPGDTYGLPKQNFP